MKNLIAILCLTTAVLLGSAATSLNAAKLTCRFISFYEEKGSKREVVDEVDDIRLQINKAAKTITSINLHTDYETKYKIVLDNRYVISATRVLDPRQKRECIGRRFDPYK